MEVACERRKFALSVANNNAKGKGMLKKIWRRITPTAMQTPKETAPPESRKELERRITVHCEALQRDLRDFLNTTVRNGREGPTMNWLEAGLIIGIGTIGRDLLTLYETESPEVAINLLATVRPQMQHASALLDAICILRENEAPEIPSIAARRAAIRPSLSPEKYATLIEGNESLSTLGPGNR